MVNQRSSYCFTNVMGIVTVAPPPSGGAKPPLETSAFWHGTIAPTPPPPTPHTPNPSPDGQS
ncbi:MAG: hypothetical protein RIF41_28590 [Polyangiaceae bacterium]